MRLEKSRDGKPRTYDVYGHVPGLKEEYELGQVQQVIKLSGRLGRWRYLTWTNGMSGFDSAEEAAEALQEAWDREEFTPYDERDAAEARAEDEDELERER